MGCSADFNAWRTRAVPRPWERYGARTLAIGCAQGEGETAYARTRITSVAGSVAAGLDDEDEEAEGR